MAVDVTVVIAAWNAASFIVAAVESALAQQGVTVEVIVVDDCSTDDTARIASSIRDDRLQVLRMEHNLGPSAARNLAIERATGRWLAVLDADDRFMPGRLQRLVALGTQQQTEVVADNLVFDRGDGKPQGLMFPMGSSSAFVRISAEQFIRHNCLMKSRYNYGFLKPLFRADFLFKHRIRYDEQIVLGEDYLFLLEVLLCGGQCLFEQTPGYLYRIHDQSVSSQRLDRNRIRGIIEGDQRLLSRYPLTSFLAAAQAQRHRSLLDADAYVAMAESLKTKDARTFFRQVVTRPLALRHFEKPARERFMRLFWTSEPEPQ